MNFFVASSQEFMPRTKVCLDSIKKFHPDSKIYFENYEGTKQGSYLEGFAKFRIQKLIELLEKEDQIIVMLGADCVLYNNYLYYLDGFIQTNSIVLVPHRITPPIKEKGAQFYMTGHANADILFVTRKSLPILKWLVEQDMKAATSQGIFYEQTWLSAVPFLFDNVHILKDKDLNIAYFNIDERLENIQSGPGMIQYSGFVEGRPEILSKYYSGQPITNPEVLKYYEDYDKAIKDNKQ